MPINELHLEVAASDVTRLHSAPSVYFLIVYVNLVQFLILCTSTALQWKFTQLLEDARETCPPLRCSAAVEWVLSIRPSVHSNTDSFARLFTLRPTTLQASDRLQHELQLLIEQCCRDQMVTRSMQLLN